MEVLKMQEVTLRTESLEAGETVISLTSTGDGTFRLHVVRERDRKFDATVPPAAVRDLLNRIERARIPLFAEGPWGLDGRSWCLTIGVGLHQATYQWWGSPGPGWEVLGEIAGRLRGLAAPLVSEYSF
jgi:hypothetical protein